MERFSHNDVPAGLAIRAHIAGLPNIPMDASQAEAKGTERHDITAFKRQLEISIRSFQILIEEMLQASKESNLAKHCFHPIIRQLDDELVRLEIWASDIGAEDPHLGRSNVSRDSDLEVTIYITSILKMITSKLEEIRKTVEEMREEMRASIGRLSRNPSAEPKRTAYLDDLLKIIDTESTLIVAEIKRLVDLTEAFRMELANSLQNGPLFEMRAHILRSREQVLRRAKPKSTRGAENTSISSEGNPEPSTRESILGNAPESGPWHGKTMLNFEGGGSRNYASLLLLKALTEEIAALERDTVPSIMSSAHPLALEPRNGREELAGAPDKKSVLVDRFLPCHYFDYIVGVGFGGIIAIMLGRLRMTVHECIENYVSLLDETWSHPRIFHARTPLLAPRPKYKGRFLSNILKKIVGDSALGTMYLQYNEDMCRTIVVNWLQGPNRVYLPYLFRSYHHLKRDGSVRNPGQSNNYPIWQVGRATTATPTYLDHSDLEESGENWSFLDGGAIAADLSLEAIKSTQNPYELGAVRVVVSIGIGNDRNVDRSKSKLSGFSSLSATVENIKSLVNTTRFIDWQTRQWAKENGARCLRLDFQNSLLGKMSLDTWRGKKGTKTLEIIRAATEAYLASEIGRETILDTARELVSIRQARSMWQADSGEWETFCHGVDYSCPLSKCKRNGRIFRLRGELRLHLEQVHRSEVKISEALLDKGKRYPR